MMSLALFSCFVCLKWKSCFFCVTPVGLCSILSVMFGVDCLTNRYLDCWSMWQLASRRPPFDITNECWQACLSRTSPLHLRLQYRLFNILRSFTRFSATLRRMAQRRRYLRLHLSRHTGRHSCYTEKSRFWLRTTLQHLPNGPSVMMSLFFLRSHMIGSSNKLIGRLQKPWHVGPSFCWACFGVACTIPIVSVGTLKLRTIRSGKNRTCLLSRRCLLNAHINCTT